jgi:hypothetical protein
MVETSLERRSRGQKHPVWDFLFTYYTFAPRRLLDWVPGIVDADGGLREFVDPPSAPDGWPAWEAPPPPPRLNQTAEWTAELCRQILDRPDRFTCCGLHEWAMVYGLPQTQIRHSHTQLRLNPTDLSRFVESQSLNCTHYDAFRFFTDNARPLNQFQPDLHSRQRLEQGGCLHANMDLYKWSAKLWPWIGSDLVGETFVLATQARALDMRASPYELKSLGFEPIPIETAAGRQQVQVEQQAIADRARPLRERLHRSALQLASWSSALSADR